MALHLHRRSVLAGGLALAAAAPLTASGQTLDQVRRAIAPTGRLRAAINLGNTVLAQANAKGEPVGVSVDLATALAQQLRLPLDLVTYPTGGAVVPGLAKDHWDVGFLAVDPERAQEVSFTAPYLYIEGTYLVAQGARFTKAADLDQEGVRIAVAKGAAYDLVLTRLLKNATLVRTETSDAAVALFLRDRLDAAAGIRQPLNDAAAKTPGLRVITDSFQRIEQGSAVPKGRPPAALAYLSRFIETQKANGFVRRALDRSGQAGAVVADPAVAH